MESCLKIQSHILRIEILIYLKFRISESSQAIRSTNYIEEKYRSPLNQICIRCQQEKFLKLYSPWQLIPVISIKSHGEFFKMFISVRLCNETNFDE